MSQEMMAWCPLTQPSPPRGEGYRRLELFRATVSMVNLSNHNDQIAVRRPRPFDRLRVRLVAAGFAAAFVLWFILSPGARADDIPANERRSGFDTMGADVQAMQRDDFANPAMLTVREGERLWASPPGEGKPACAACHGDAPASMKGVAARYPALDAASGRPIDLSRRIQQCQSERQGVAASHPESRPLLALSTYVALQSRGEPIAPPTGPALDAARARGKALYSTRMGQLDLSCAQCHTDNHGRRLGGTRIPQAHPTGYPLFRLEWQEVGSLQRRIRNCMTGVRAEPFAFDAAEMIELELHLMSRAAGMAMDAPAVRP
jgi:L-cysteine S-thiosulfotransferase